MENTLSYLNAISPLDARYWETISDLADNFSEFALFRYRLLIELKYLLFLSKETNILNKLSVQEDILLNKIVQDFNQADYIKIKSYEQSTKHDVKALEYFLTDKLGGTSLSGICSFIHFGLTSEDVNNLSYAILVTDFLDKIYKPKLNELLNVLNDKSLEYKQIVMLGRTHGQAAVPTTLGKEIAVFAYRLKDQADKLRHLKLSGKLNGAVGNYNALTFTFPKINWLVKSQKFVESLGLSWNPLTTQIEGNDSLVELFDRIRHINTILLGLCQDMWHYISDGIFKLKVEKTAVGSSTMPHKVNPIDFENAEGNLGIANTLFTFFANKLPISRLQRDLSDSTVKRNMGVAFGHTIFAFTSLESGLSKISPNTEKIAKMLEGNWAILAEAVQTLLRAKGVNRSYELVKEFTQGVTLSQKDYLKLINKLPVAGVVKKQLKKLTPKSYLGLSTELVDLATKE